MIVDEIKRGTRSVMLFATAQITGQAGIASSAKSIASHSLLAGTFGPAQTMGAIWIKQAPR